MATGTGSGKTESFLLPILERAFRRACRRDAGPGVRALLLYPDERAGQRPDQAAQAATRACPAHHLRPVRGRHLRGRPAEAAEKFAVLNPGEPRLPNELLSRAEMRERPPHILLTNYAMLEYLLLRPADIDLFEGAHGGHWSFIVVDEAHVYDGAKAAELAMLLRRLRDRVAQGRPLQCIATSATVGDDPRAVTEFAQRLFDADFEWVPSDESRQDLVRATRRDMPEGPFWGPLDPAAYLSVARADDPAAELCAWPGHMGAALHDDAAVTLRP